MFDADLQRHRGDAGGAPILFGEEQAAGLDPGKPLGVGGDHGIGCIEPLLVEEPLEQRNGFREIVGRREPPNLHSRPSSARSRRILSLRPSPRWAFGRSGGASCSSR